MVGFVAPDDDLASNYAKAQSRSWSPDVQFDETHHFFHRRPPRRSGVAVISGGGAGHEPLHGGYVGMGMLDAACIGHVFSSPTPDRILAAMAHVDLGQGVVQIVKNYDGDVMNFEIAAELHPGEVRRVLVADDVATIGSRRADRGARGIAGTVIAERIAGAAAEEGLALDDVAAAGQRAADQTRSIAVAWGGCTVPATGEPTFTLLPGEMEYGVGIHGERGIARISVEPPDRMLSRMIDDVLDHLGPADPSRMIALVNGLGGITQLELGRAAQHAIEILSLRLGGAPACCLVGNYATALDMPGLSISLSALDRSMFDLWNTPVSTPVLNWGKDHT